MNSDLRVELFDGCARLHPRRDAWQVAVRGHIGRPRPDSLRKRLFLRFVRRALRFTEAEMESELFQERVRDFLMIAPRRRQIQISVNGTVVTLPKRSRGDGFFSSSVMLTPSQVAAIVEATALGETALQLETVATEDVLANHQGRAELIGHQGPSVISDIDDTIKLSQVGDRSNLFANTFLRPFVAVPGMADVFRTWRAGGASFHYVSSSPWQLYRPLRRFLEANGFPHGAYHLRSIRLRGPRIVELFVGRKSAKRRAIKGLLRWYPQRRFVLVGDSGEKDPAIYGAIYRRFPQQIERIFIRRVPDRPFDAERIERAFARVPPEVWHIFENPADLLRTMPQRNVGWR